MSPALLARAVDAAELQVEAARREVARVADQLWAPIRLGCERAIRDGASRRNVARSLLEGDAALMAACMRLKRIRDRYVAIGSALWLKQEAAPRELARDAGARDREDRP